MNVDLESTIFVDRTTVSWKRSTSDKIM
jgi:hypothetical protein